MNNKTKGIICIIASAFFFSLMSLFVRMAGDLPTMEKAFFRNAIAAAFFGAVLVIKPTAGIASIPSFAGLLAFGEIPDALSICGYVIIIAMAVLKWRQSFS